MATKKKTTMQKLADNAAADAMLRRPMEPTLTLVQPTTIEALTSPVNDVGGEADPFAAQLADENRISAACYTALLAETKTARPPMPTTTDPASSMTQAQIETKAKQPKATTMHAFALVTAYGIALATKRAPVDAVRDVLASFPSSIRRRAIELARKKELPGGGCDNALKALADEQPVATATSTRTASGSTAATLKVTGTTSKYIVVRVNAEIQAGLFQPGASFSVVRSVVDGKLTITLVQQ